MSTSTDTDFPASIDDTTSLPNPIASNTTREVPHAELHTAQNKAIIAVQAKIGTGASTPIANKVLMGSGTGTSSWSDAVPESSIDGLVSDLSAKANSADLASVATSGSYNDLSGAPSIPSTFDDLTDGTTNKAFTTTDKAKFDGIEALADVTDADNVGSTIHGVSSKATPADTDELGLIDSAASNVLKKLTWANLKTTVKSYYDTVISTLTNKDLTSVTNTFPIFNQDSTGKSAKTDALNSATTVVNVSSSTAPSNGQVLTATSSTTATWQNSSSGFADPTTTKGDLIVHGASTTRLPVGTNGQVLTADSTQADGVKWAATSGTGDMLAATYDPNSVAGDAFSMDKMEQGSTNKYVTAAELTVLGNTSGTNTGDQTTITGNAGTATTLATARTINGVSFNGSASITVPGLVWTVKTSSTTAVVNNGYICNAATLVTITLPTSYAVGTTVRVVGIGTGGWKIALPSGDNIVFGSVASSNGTAGYLASTNQNDAVELVCSVANTTWVVVGSVGNITIV